MESTFTTNIFGNDASTNKYRKYIGQSQLVQQLDKTFKEENAKNRSNFLDVFSRTRWSQKGACATRNKRSDIFARLSLYIAIIQRKPLHMSRLEPILHSIFRHGANLLRVSEMCRHQLPTI